MNYEDHMVCSLFTKNAVQSRPSPRLPDVSHSTIDKGDIDIWQIDLAQPDRTQWGPVLTTADHARAQRYIHVVHRDRFAQARYCLRLLLAAYSEQPPDSLEFVNNAHGKPALAPQYGLGFNLSRSGNSAVIAIGRAPAIGIDIEQRVLPDRLRALASTVFSDVENQTSSSYADEALTTAFLINWTRKEAYLKAIGIGLAIDPRRLTVGLHSERTPVEDITAKGIVDVETVCSTYRVVISLAVVASAHPGYRETCMHQFLPTELREA